MKKLSFFFILVAAFGSSTLCAQSRSIVEEYIVKYKDIAMAEMARTGVPASITLAQGIHESGAGTSDLVQRSNNHFGIKCKTEWTGEKVYHDDDARGECFRKYDDPFISYKDHSDFLRTRKHYSSLFELDPEDYEAWAYGLKKAGYATNPKYPQILIKLIRDYNLQDYSLIVLGKKQPGETEPAWVKLNTPAAEEETAVVTRNSEASNAAKPVYPQGVFTINDTKVVAVTKGASYLKVAEEHNISLARLFEFNDLKDGDVAMEDGLLFLQRKRKTGANEFHVVAAGETLYGIAQTQGIRLESLLEYNQLAANATVQAGETLYLKSQAPSSPKLLGIFSLKKDHKPKEETALVIEKQPAPQIIVHVVQPKDTVYSIARKYAVEVNDVKKWNEMQSTDLKIGQQLKINKSR